MANVPGRIGGIQGVFDNAGKFIGISDPTNTGDGADYLLPTYVRNANDNISGLSSLDNGVIQLRNANTLAIIGDSISADWRFISADSNSRQANGFISWAQAFSGDRLTVVSDNSVGGSGVTANLGGVQMSTTQVDAAIASGAGHVLLMGGINDLGASVSVAAIQAAFLTIINKLVEKNITVWWCTILPLNATTTAITANILFLNSWIRQQCSTRFAKKGVVCIDTWSKAVNPASATGSYITNGTADNVHPTNLCAYYVGKEVARVWNLFIPQSQSLLGSNIDNVGFSTATNNVLTNGLFLTGASPGTGFTLTATGSAVNTSNSLVARADGYGNDLQVACTFSANGELVRVQSGDLKANVVNGDTIVAECELTITSPVNLKNISFSINTFGTQNVTAASMRFDTGASIVAMPEGFTVILRTNPITINDALNGVRTSIDTRLALTGGGVGGCTYKIGRWSLRKIIVTE